MKPVEETYGKRFFARRKSLNWRVPIMADAIVKVFNPETVIDVGCATGDILSGLQERNISVTGFEGSKEVLDFMEVGPSRIHVIDIRRPLEDFWTNIKFDVVMSLEVAEHIEPEFAEQYVKNLCSLGNTILLTAAPPGQGGHGHVNCQPQEYWIRLFREHGFLFNNLKTLETRGQLFPWKHKKGIKAYYDNAMVFDRKEDE